MRHHGWPGEQIRGIGQAATQRKGCKRSAAPAEVGAGKEEGGMEPVKDHQGMKIIGIDNGYGNIKTANCCFPAGLTVHDEEPLFKDDLLVYEGRYPQRICRGQDRTCRR